MQQKTSASIKNRILSRLSAADMALLKPDLEPVELPLRHVLEVPNKPIQHSYFIEYGLASIVAANGHKRLEVGLIGCEGMTGLPIVLGNDRSPNETFMQVPGNGMRIPADKLRKPSLKVGHLNLHFLALHMPS
jgi:CRP-like cAMP-binding protein